MKKLSRLFIYISLILQSSCLSEKIIRYPEYNYYDLPIYKFNVDRIEVESLYNPKFIYPNVEHLAPADIETSFRRYIQKNMEANAYNTGRILKIIIIDASIIEKNIAPIERTIWNMLAPTYNIEYVSGLEAHFQIIDKNNNMPGNVKAKLEIRVSRSQLASRRDSLDQKEQLLYDLTKDTIYGIAKEFDKSAYNNFADYIE